MKNDKIKELVKKLAEFDENQRKELAEKLYIITTCESHRLSEDNSILIHCQNKTEIPITMVGGYRQWTRHNRQVKKGAHGFLIRYPMKPKKEEKQQEETSNDNETTHFWWAYVFDVSQTEEMYIPSQEANKNTDWITEIANETLYDKTKIEENS